MNYSKRHRLRIIALALLLSQSGRVTLAETWDAGEVTYENVRIREITPATVTIFHAGGIAQLQLQDLPWDLQKRFNYEAETAEQWRSSEARRIEEEITAAREATAATRDRIARENSRKARRSSQPKVISPDQVVFHEEVDLRPRYREMGLFLKNQGRRPSCSIFALVSALEYEQGQMSGRAERLSEEFLIWATLQMHPGIPLDTAFSFTEVITALQTYGVPTHTEMPNTYGKGMARIEPEASVITSARERRSAIPVWFRSDDPHLIERLVSVLNQEKPIVIGVRWPSWHRLRRNFLLDTQPPLEGAGHAVTLIGYRNPSGDPEATTFIFRNSYGNQWGNGGCGLISAEYLQRNLLGAFFMKVE